MLFVRLFDIKALICYFASPYFIKMISWTTQIMRKTSILGVMLLCSTLSVYAASEEIPACKVNWGDYDTSFKCRLDHPNDGYIALREAVYMKCLITPQTTSGSIPSYCLG